ncbi:MAG: hypothetical protein LRZ84_19780 [Desertifilum sp.]|nr:hypothetical protein [Desertifilum sp.]
MKNIHYLLLGGALAAVIGGAAFATAIHQRQDEPSQPIVTNPSPSPSPEPVAQNPSPANPGTRPTPQPPAPPKYPEFEHRRITLADEVQPGTEFHTFREQLRQAVKSRDARFVRSLIPANGVTLGFGGPQSAEDLNLNSPQSRFWSLLEKSTAIGCTAQKNEYFQNAVQGDRVWVCANINQAFRQQYPAPPSYEGIEWELTHVVVVGENVNVRSQPSLNSSAINVLSNEVVEVDRPALEKYLDRLFSEGKEHDPIEGWTPVKLSNGQAGYVYNRFVYAPLEYRAVFGQVNGQWQLIHMPGGD